MTKPFDTTLKDLLNVFAVDWADWLGPEIGLSANIEVEPLDVDLSTVQMSADKVFRLKAPAEGLLHIEPQASRDSGFPGRMLQYSLLLDDRYEGPVYSVACCCDGMRHRASRASSVANSKMASSISVLNTSLSKCGSYTSSH